MRYFYNLSISNNEGFVGISFDNPKNFAPLFAKRKVSHVPLKPVCPVISTFFY